MKIRILLYTNAVKFSQAIYDGLKSGAIEYVVNSIDCGVPSTYKKMKRADVYGKVIENAAKYSNAARFNGAGMFAVKYILTSDNTSEDDIYSFAYSMIAIKPSKIWMTFDFEPFGEIGGESEDFGRFDFTNQINAYKLVFELLLKHGIEVVNYVDGHLAKISKAGKILTNKLNEIENEVRNKLATLPQSTIDMLCLAENKIKNNNISTNNELHYGKLDIQSGSLLMNGATISIRNKKILVLPASINTRHLVENEWPGRDQIVGFIDKSEAIAGKEINKVKIFKYSEINNMDFDLLITIPPAQHKIEIMEMLYKYLNTDKLSKIVVLDKIDW